MKQLSSKAPIEFIQTAETYRGREIQIELHPGFVNVKLKGCKETSKVSTTYGAIYEMAMKQEAWRKR